MKSKSLVDFNPSLFQVRYLCVFLIIYRFHYSLPFSDKDGLLVLSPNQKKHFARWVRPHEICSDPKIVAGGVVNYLAVKQTVRGIIV